MANGAAHGVLLPSSTGAAQRRERLRTAVNERLERRDGAAVGGDTDVLRSSPRTLRRSTPRSTLLNAAETAAHAQTAASTRSQDPASNSR